MKGLKVGQDVWYVPSDRRHQNPNGSLRKVTKIGKKYFYLDDLKCECWDNGYSIGNVCEYPHGSIYLTEQDYIDNIVWKNFTYNIPTDLTKDQKKRILEIINE